MTLGFGFGGPRRNILAGLWAQVSDFGREMNVHGAEVQLNSIPVGFTLVENDPRSRLSSWDT